MDEHEWLDSTDPSRMRVYLSDKATERKLRLFACACCRQIWNSLCPEDSRRVVEVNELFADNQTNGEDLGRARSKAHNAAWSARIQNQREGKPTEIVVRRLYFAAFMANTANRLLRDQMPLLSEDAELSVASPSLFRDIFGNPYRPVTLDPRWLSSTVLDLANVIYADRAFERLPVLADALMDAGCDNEAILNHCRSEGPHVRGCWVVDLVLGKQ